MGALFDDATVVEDDDVVGFEDGVEAVCDGNDGSTLHDAAGGFFEQGFGLGVEAGGGFVEDEDGRVFEEGSGEGETLCLSAAETGSAFADDGLVFGGERFDEVMQVRGLGGGGYFGDCRFGLAQFDVVGNGVVEEVGFLRNPGNRRMNASREG